MNTIEHQRRDDRRAPRQLIWSGVDDITTWRERIGAGPDFPLHAPTDVERAMVAENGELRAYASRLEEFALDEARLQYLASTFQRLVSVGKAPVEAMRIALTTTDQEPSA